MNKEDTKKLIEAAKLIIEKLEKEMAEAEGKNEERIFKQVDTSENAFMGKTK